MLLEGIKITNTDGTSNWIPSNYIASVKHAAPTGNSPFLQGRLTAYTVQGVAETVVASYSGANVLVELGGFTNDGLFVAASSNGRG
jgi:hypothetical protein